MRQYYGKEDCSLSSLLEPWNEVRCYVTSTKGHVYLAAIIGTNNMLSHHSVRSLLLISRLGMSTFHLPHSDLRTNYNNVWMMIWYNGISVSDDLQVICPVIHHIEGLVQECSNSSALAVELLQPCTKPSILIFQYLQYKSTGRTISKYQTSRLLSKC